MEFISDHPSKYLINKRRRKVVLRSCSIELFINAKLAILHMHQDELICIVLYLIDSKFLGTT